MTVSREKGEIYLECDANRCAEVIECHTKDFGEALDFAKENGWRVRVTGQNRTWQHYCPDEDLDGLNL